MNKKIKQPTYKFRPNNSSVPFIKREAHYGDPSVRKSFSIRSRQVWDRKRPFLCRVFSRVHVYTSHSPGAVAKRYKQADVRFDRRFGDSDRASRRFINEYTAHAWA
jgi:hypothetical protein